MAKRESNKTSPREVNIFPADPPDDLDQRIQTFGIIVFKEVEKDLRRQLKQQREKTKPPAA